MALIFLCDYLGDRVRHRETPERGWFYYILNYLFICLFERQTHIMRDCSSSLSSVPLPQVAPMASVATMTPMARARSG